MIHMQAVRHFVRDHPPADVRGRHHQSPIVANGARRRATAPSRLGVANRHGADGDPGAFRDLACFGRQDRSSFRAQPSLDPSTHAFERTANDQSAVYPFDPSAGGRLPVDHMPDPVDRDARSGLDGFAGWLCGDLSFHPLALACGPIERCSAAGARRTGQPDFTAPRIEPQFQTARARVDNDRDRPGKVRMVKAAGRQGAIPGRRHRPR